MQIESPPAALPRSVRRHDHREDSPDGRIERVALDALELAANARREISREGSSASPQC